MSTLTYTDNFIVDVRIDAYGFPFQQYGGKVRTPYMVTCVDGRTRRVYAMSYGNAASLYVVVGGVDTFLGIDDEHALERARNAANA